jgi:alpha-beta hydrolase superfamily lysophospholipase
LASAAAVLTPTLRVACIPLGWLSRQRQVIERFRDDPLVFHGRFTVRMAAEILRAMKNLSQKATSLHAPLLILHGGEDRICGPAGSLALHQSAGSADKTVHLYEGFYHEVFDETPHERVLADLSTWLNQHFSPADAAACHDQVKT